jgi:hypothetical protein
MSFIKEEKLMLFNNPPKAVILIVVFLTLFVLGLALNKCHAAEGPTDAPYVQFSGGSAIVRGEAPVIDVTYTYPAPQLHGAFWQGSMDIVGSSTYNNQNVSNNMILRGLFADGFGRFDVGLGVGWMLNPSPYNGSNVNFNLQLDYRFIDLPITLTYTHLSDAGITSHNLGRDIVLIGYRFR